MTTASSISVDEVRARKPDHRFGDPRDPRGINRDESRRNEPILAPMLVMQKPAPAVLRFRMDRRRLVNLGALVAVLLGACSSGSTQQLRHGLSAGSRFEVRRSQPPQELVSGLGVFATVRDGAWFNKSGDAMKLSFVDLENRSTRPMCARLEFDTLTLQVKTSSWVNSWGNLDVHYVKPGQTITQAAGIAFGAAYNGVGDWPYTEQEVWEPSADGTCGDPPRRAAPDCAAAAAGASRALFPGGDPDSPSLLPFRTAVSNACTRGSWGSAAVQCVVDARDADQLEACRLALTEEQQEILSEELTAAQSEDDDDSEESWDPDVGADPDEGGE